MYILIALLTMTTLGQYQDQASCENAIREIYTQRINPYGYMKPEDVKKVVDIQMQYAAPRQFRCQKQ